VTLKTVEQHADVRHMSRRLMTVPPARTGSRLRRTGLRLSAAALATLATMSVAAVSAPATSASASTVVPAAAGRAPASETPPRPDNPLRGRWGVYKGLADQAWAPYESSSGVERQLLGKIALRPRATWFGAWTSNADIAAKVQKYIANMSGGDPSTLVQMTIFRVKPWEHDACTRLPTADEQASYKQWIDRFAGAVGAQHTAIVLQPDGPFALCAPGGSKLPSQLIAYASRTLSALPNTSVYIDAGASDWPSNDPAKAAQILLPAGIQYARGFALNSTHYSRTVDNIDFGTRLVGILADHGFPGKHFVINTSSNGHGFTFNQARGGNRDNAKVCDTPTERVCVTLGPTPTTNVASSRWGQSTLHKQEATAHVDAYLWIGRPWLYMQADPFVKSRALAMARTTPY
jgi:endoglucanase